MTGMGLHRLVLTLALLGFISSLVEAASLPTLLRQINSSNIDGSYQSEYQFSSNCPNSLSVSGTVVRSSNSDVSDTPVSGISVDGVQCSGGTMTTVTSAIAADSTALQALGLQDVAERLAANKAASATVNGGFDQAITYVGFDNTERVCGSKTYPLATFYFFIRTSTSTQAISIETAAGKSTTTIPENTSAVFIAGESTLLCIAVDSNNATAQQSPSVLPQATPGNIASIFDDEVPITFDKDIPVANETGGGENACFPGAARAQLATGENVPLESLKVGDTVRTGVNSVSDVVLFTHRESDSEREFVKLTTSHGNTLALSAGHYLHVGELGRLISADEVSVGDLLLLANENNFTMVVEKERVFRRGLYNPQTVDGNIVIDGVIVSAYTRAVHPKLAHDILLAPVRWFYSLRLPGSKTMLGSLFARGSSKLASCLPSGPALVST